MAGADATTRFSDRVENYVRYRPGYPAEVLDVLRAEAGLAPGLALADVGSGTGISARLFLDAGHPVYAVEPNAEMRAAAETMLGGDPRFHSVAGSAEATTLPDASVDLVVAAQAFHWFDPAAVAPEWRRILRPGGWIVLLWNTRQTDSTPFLRAYEALLREHGTDYTTVNHENVTVEALRAVLGDGYARRVVPSEQVFDFDALKGRLLSSSYAPNVDHPGHAPMMDALRRIFDEHAAGGHVRFLYDTEIYFGRGA
jgi:SAM-dependent methyltransferase